MMSVATNDEAINKLCMAYSKGEEELVTRLVSALILPAIVDRLSHVGASPDRRSPVRRCEVIEPAA